MPTKNTQDYFLSLMKLEDTNRFSKLYTYTTALYVAGVILSYVFITVFAEGFSSWLLEEFSLIGSIPRLRFDHNHLTKMVGLDVANRIVAAEIAIILVTLFCAVTVFYFSYSLLKRNRTKA